MYTIRIIPRLDVKGPNLVKGIHLEGLRVLGKPEYYSRHYYEQGADELLYIDVVASLYGRNSILPIIERTAKEIFIPLTVGGGLRSLDDIRMALKAGADKVSLNTAAINRPTLISQAAERFGSSTIVVSIEAIKKPDGRYKAYTENGREKTDLDAIEWAHKAADLGAGEILLTSINQEGTGRGFDIDLVRQVADSVSIPVIACGGAGSVEHIESVIKEGKADAVSIASILHYNIVRHYNIEDDFSEEGNIEFLKKNIDQLRSGEKGFGNIHDCSLKEIKTYLLEKEVSCRH